MAAAGGSRRGELQFFGSPRTEYAACLRHVHGPVQANDVRFALLGDALQLPSAAVGVEDEGRLPRGAGGQFEQQIRRERIACVHWSSSPLGESSGAQDSDSSSRAREMMRTLQEPILLLLGVCFRDGGFPNLLGGTGDTNTAVAPASFALCCAGVPTPGCDTTALNCRGRVGAL